MNRFLAVVVHEYKKVVLKWSFLVGTLLLPVLAGVFAFVPAIIFSLKGEPTRIALIDRSGTVAPRLKDNLSAEKMAERARKAAADAAVDITPSQEEQLRRTSAQLVESFIFADIDPAGRSLEDIRADLTSRITADEFDAYLIIPPDVNDTAAVYEFRSRKGADFITNDSLRDALNSAVRSQRLAEANISEERLAAIGKPVVMDAKGLDDRGGEKDTTGLMIASFVIGLMIYITLAIYGQAIMGAVVEEKETRISEILFSSARPFTLLFGKLVGVGLAGLTQLAIWIVSAAALLAFLALQTDLSQLVGAVPEISLLMIFYFLIYFLIGYFIYASIFALIGSVVTSLQEGGQFAFPPVMLLLVAFYFSLAVIRDPNSTLSFWVSIAPFFAPITMPIRIMAETPPFWQIALSIGINVLAIAGLVWLASRVYRVGMLMYGKRATIPEIWKWIRYA